MEQPDLLVRQLSADGTVVCKAVVATRLVADALGRRSYASTAADGLARTLVAAVLLAGGDKRGASVQLQLRGSGPLRSILAIAEPDGRVRGTVGRADVYLPELPGGGRSALSRAIGDGVLSVVRSHPDWRDMQRGSVSLASGEVAMDVARYLQRSEQVPAAVGLGVSLTPEGEVESAGGFLVEALPGASDATLASLESQVGAITSPALAAGAEGGARRMLDHLMADVGGREIEQLQPRFHCPCSRERALRTLSLLEREELEEIAAGRGQEVCCDFCGFCYWLEPGEVRTLLAALT